MPSHRLPFGPGSGRLTSLLSMRDASSSTAGIYVLHYYYYYYYYTVVIDVR